MKLWVAALFFLLAWLFASEGLGFLAAATIIVMAVLALAGFYGRSPSAGVMAGSPEDEVDASQEAESEKAHGDLKAESEKGHGEKKHASPSKHSEPWGDKSASQEAHYPSKKKH